MLQTQNGIPQETKVLNLLFVEQSIITVLLSKRLGSNKIMNNPAFSKVISTHNSLYKLRQTFLYYSQLPFGLAK